MIAAMTRWSELLVSGLADLGFVVVAAGILLCVVRLLRGPTLADRALALDTIAIHLIALVILFSLNLNSLVLFDGILVLSLLGFAGTVAVAQYIARPHIAKHASPGLQPPQPRDGKGEVSRP